MLKSFLVFVALIDVLFVEMQISVNHAFRNVLKKNAPFNWTDERHAFSKLKRPWPLYLFILAYRAQWSRL